MALGQITKARAEEILRDLVSGGEEQSSEARQWVEDLIERSRKATEDIVGMVRAEVSNQLAALGLDPDHLGSQAADLLRRSTEVGRRSRGSAGSQHAPRPPFALKAGPPTAPAGMTTPFARGATGPAKQAAAKKAPAAKRTATRAATAKKAAGTENAPAKKTAAAKTETVKKTAVKKTAVKKTAAAKKAAATGDTATPSKASTKSAPGPATKAPPKRSPAKKPPTPAAGPDAG